jgi:hypothetical protein
MKCIFSKAAMALVLMSLYMTACSPKYGCPANGRSTGAEKYLDGSKVPKAKKFKA